MNFYETLAFKFRGQDHVIDLSPFGATGSLIGITERCEQAQRMLHHLTVMRVEIQADHMRLKAALSKTFVSMLGQGEKHVQTREDAFIDGRPEYIESRRIRDFVDYAYETVQFAIPRLRRLEEHALENERRSHPRP